MAVKCVFDYIYFELLGWTDINRTRFCSACSTSAVHSTILCQLLWNCLKVPPHHPSTKMSSHPQAIQDDVVALLQLCTGYMIYDYLGMIMYNNWTLSPEDVVIFLHHLNTVIYMSSTRVLAAGHISTMTLMFWGEITNPIHNTFNVTRFAIQMAPLGSWWHSIHPFVEFSYSISYAFVRTVMGPYHAIKITYDFWFTEQGRQNIPMLIRVFWCILMWGILIGSIPWIQEAFEMMSDGFKIKYDKNFDHGSKYEEL